MLKKVEPGAPGVGFTPGSRSLPRCSTIEPNKSLSPRQNIQSPAAAARLLRWECGPRFLCEAARVERTSRRTPLACRVPRCVGFTPGSRSLPPLNRINHYLHAKIFSRPWQLPVFFAGSAARAFRVKPRAWSGPRNVRLRLAANKQRFQTNCTPEGCRGGRAYAGC
jgi:hypothetical protein